MIVPVAVWVVGRAVRARRDHEAWTARQALVDERLRLARDLHDGLAHRLRRMLGLLRTVDEDPQDAAQVGTTPGLDARTAGRCGRMWC